MKKINKDYFIFWNYKLLSHINIHKYILKTVEKDLVIGLGEIGLPIFKLLSRKIPTEGFDKNPELNIQKS